MLQTFTTCAFGIHSIIHYPLLMPLQLLLRSQCKNDTLNSLGFGGKCNLIWDVDEELRKEFLKLATETNLAYYETTYLFTHTNDQIFSNNLLGYRELFGKVSFYTEVEL